MVRSYRRVDQYHIGYYSRVTGKRLFIQILSFLCPAEP